MEVGKYLKAKVTGESSGVQRISSVSDMGIEEQLVHSENCQRKKKLAET